MDAETAKIEAGKALKRVETEGFGANVNPGIIKRGVIGAIRHTSELG